MEIDNRKFLNLFNSDTLEKRHAIITQRKNIVLEETDPSSKMNVNILKNQGEIIQICLTNASTIRPPSGVSNSQICDYIILTVEDDVLYAILVELKLKLRDENKPYDQLKISRALLDYFLSAYEIEYDEKIDPEIRYVMIYEEEADTLDKQTTRAISSRRQVKKYGSMHINLLRAHNITIGECIEMHDPNGGK